MSPFISRPTMTDHRQERPRGEPAPGAPDELPGPVRAPRRFGPLSALKALAIAITLLVSLSVWGMCFWWIDETTTPRAWKNDAIVLEGEFREDGSCVVREDGQPLWPSADSMRTEFDQMSIYGAAPEGYDVPQVVCGPRPKEGYFFVWGPVAKGTPVRAGRYRIAPDAISDGDTVAWEATLFHPAYDDQKAYLIGYDGYVRFIRADSAAVAGTFRVVARRKLRGPF